MSGEERFARRARVRQQRVRSRLFGSRSAAALAAACEGELVERRQKALEVARVGLKLASRDREGLRTIPARRARAGQRRAMAAQSQVRSTASCFGPLVDDALRLAERSLDLTRREHAHFRGYANMRFHRVFELAGGVIARLAESDADRAST